MQLMRDSLNKSLQTKPLKSDLKPEFFCGNSNEFAAINNWNTSLKLSVFPLYLKNDLWRYQNPRRPTSDHMGGISEVSREIQFAVSARG